MLQSSAKKSKFSGFYKLYRIGIEKREGFKDPLSWGRKKATGKSCPFGNSDQTGLISKNQAQILHSLFLKNCDTIKKGEYYE